VSLSAEHVAVAARSERYARRTGSDASMQMAPLSRFWKAADGWVRLHANYPGARPVRRHQPRLMSLLAGSLTVAKPRSAPVRRLQERRQAADG
jgi:hypothetical protein